MSYSRWALSCVGLLAFACGDDAAPAHTQFVAEIVPQRVPVLGCFENVVSPGLCARDGDCADNLRCVLDAEQGFEDRDPIPLHCAAQLGKQPARSSCKSSADCQSGLCGLPNLCLAPCRSALDCDDQSVCRPIEARVADGLGPVMACARSLVLPDDVVLSSGQREDDLRHGSSTVTVPGSAEPGLVYVQSSCDEAGFDVLKLRSLDLMRDVYDSAAGHQENTILHDGTPLAALLFPDNPALAPSALGLTVDVRASAKQHVDVLLASRARGRGVLDLNVFYVGGGVELSGDPTGFHPGEPAIAALLSRLDQRFRALGLSLGELREYDVVGALREELSVLEVPKSKVSGRVIEGRPLRLDELFELSAGLESVGINVFVVRDMSSYVGIAGGIPGVLGLHGQARSGVAIAADTLGDLADAELVLMHELGHFLGLFHTTESSGLVLEPLADTPECGVEQDADHDGALSTVECADYGADNLMFWTGLGSLLTAQQIDVMASSVVFR